MSKFTSWLRDAALIGIVCVGFSSLTGCLATSGDIARIEAAQVKLESVLANRDATTEELDAALKEYADELRAVRDQVEERGKGLMDDLSDPGNWGPAGIASILLHLYRNKTRKEQLPPAGGSVA